MQAFSLDSFLDSTLRHQRDTERCNIPRTPMTPRQATRAQVDAAWAKRDAKRGSKVRA